MTKARIQLFCRANNINLVHFDGIRGYLGSVTEKYKALYLHSNHFCLIWKSGKVNFNQTFKEMKDNVKKVDNFITGENVKSHFEYIYTLKKNEPHLTTFIVYDLETHNTERARPYVFFY